MDILRAPELLGCALLIIATFLLFKQLAPFKRRRAPSLPCPRALPLVGNLYQLGALPHASLAAMAEKHAAPLMLLRLGSVPTLVVSTADAARAAFQANDRAMSGRPATCAGTRLSYGLQDITFASSSDSPAWRAARRACLSELLGAPRVRGFRDVRESEAAALVAAVTSASGSCSPRQVCCNEQQDRAACAFGDNGELTAESKAVLEEAQKLLGAFFVADYIPWLGWLDTLLGTRRRLDKNFHELDAFYERVISDHLNKRAVSKEEDLVDVLLRLHDDPAQRNTFGSRSRIKAILMDMLIAGTDTAAATLEWTMTELLRHPDALAKAQLEVRSLVGDRDMVRESDLQELHYLKLVIRESLRLHPPAPLLLPRVTTEPCTVQGCEIPARTWVLVNAKAIGLDTGVWGPDARLFVPERHEGDGVELSNHKPWHDNFALIPFGIGRRSCPAAHFATAVVELLLANLLLCFDWRAPLGEVDVEEQSSVVVYRKNPLVLVAERRCFQ
ncbi:hypothetical protein EJB05_56107, partial [Eragrostis curvula]